MQIWSYVTRDRKRKGRRPQVRCIMYSKKGAGPPHRAPELMKLCQHPRHGPSEEAISNCLLLMGIYVDNFQFENIEPAIELEM